MSSRISGGIYCGVDCEQQERATISCDHTSHRNTPKGDISFRTLDNAGPRSLVKIYCACGKIVDLDRKEMHIKKSLKKELECTACRNIRIAKDIDFLNAHFERDLSIEDDLFC